MEINKGIEILKELKAIGFSGRFTENIVSVRFPLNHTIDIRQLKSIVFRYETKYYFHIKKNTMDLVIF